MSSEGGDGPRAQSVESQPESERTQPTQSWQRSASTVTIATALHQHTPPQPETSSRLLVSVSQWWNLSPMGEVVVSVVSRRRAAVRTAGTTNFTTRRQLSVGTPRVKRINVAVRKFSFRGVLSFPCLPVTLKDAFIQVKEQLLSNETGMEQHLGP
ncbi:hypothetical protein CRENBAI_011645 [Crenichthys baileyi]|uniref:Uncharacterized protein n=1 Tax=Crenichthys baileyi TaxID=28760 RepID=A0AAV9SL00_9TELE